jgi:hypothetical protein
LRCTAKEFQIRLSRNRTPQGPEVEKARILLHKNVFLTRQNSGHFLLSLFFGVLGTLTFAGATERDFCAKKGHSLARAMFCRFLGCVFS